MYTDMKPDYTPAELQEVFEFLVARRVPLIHAAHLLCSLAGINFKRVADAAGIGRGHLYMMLRGIRPASDSARRAFLDLIGLDPWAPIPTSPR